MKWVADHEDVATFLEILSGKNDTKHKKVSNRALKALS